MCKSVAEGGMRCAAHTRPEFEAALEAVTERAHNPARFNDSAREWEATPEADEVFTAIAEHASTPQGHKEVLAKAKELYKVSGKINKFSLFMSRARNRGEELTEARKEAAKIIKKEKAKREGHRGGGAGTGSVEKLKPSVGTTAENNCLAVFPDIGNYWYAEDNDGIGPDQVRPGSNGQLNWRCAECKRLISRHNYRVNTMTTGLRAGRVPVCEVCDPRRKARFASTQAQLTSLTDALGDDPDAFNALSPALQYSLLVKMGLLKGSEDSMNRQIGMSIVHGDLTLKDVVTAQDYATIDERVRDNLDDDEALATITDIDINTDDNSPQTTAAAVDQVLASAGVLDLVSSDTDLAAHIERENNEQLWANADTNADDLDGYVAYLNSRKGHSAQADAAIDRFTTELETVRNTPLPEGYQTTRTNPDGTTLTIEPTLMQRRFAALVADRRRFMNWSGTGAGKTLSATLAVQTTGARETLVVCPKAVLGQWESEFTNGFPDNVEIRRGLPNPNETLPPPPEGKNRVWVVNYDQFQGDTTGLAAKINPLADRVDAIVYDEIHMAKATDPNDRSRRRNALEKFTDRAGRANPDLVVIGASATPVVNNLEEAASVLRLVEGPDSKKFPTKPTIKNAAAAHHRLAAAGIRQLPNYPTSLTRADETVDITPNIHQVQARINAYRKNTNGKSTRVTPAMMERALLPEKLPTIVAKAKTNKTDGAGPTIIYTEYTTGMVNPMRKALEAEGLTVGTYTGKESAAERTANLNAFRTGKLDVLIGSRPIATGVDGLQHVSSRGIVASMAWTAAQDDQLVGRLQRRGQTNNVQWDYVLTEAKAGNARWSWCKDNRQKRVRFKRDMANAAVDGILPDGALDNDQNSAEKALDSLKNLTSALARQHTPTAA